ncbi:hypothetical protein QAD02_000172 [Eretmocerus hayati]|uniref:Uncharacterized protein n=1 Tax=Eretmocerus hayati TaxID=131215 RepID=A0ACC2NDR0_9HYME|nr:hypothetical protein QAD02_000172 [Eretmocerus hayati]
MDEASDEVNVSEFHRTIIKYFNQDYSRKAILALVRKKYNVIISLSTLSRIQRRYKLRRKNITESPIEHILLALSIELGGSGAKLGYKAMWKRLRNVYELKVKQRTVMELLQLFDPLGVEERCRCRLKHRQYDVPGPDYCWHCDNHDKWKRFGFAIYGIIDGFSRKVLSIQVASTNNKPEVISYQYVKTIVELDRIPTILRTDKGTEAPIMGDMQMALRSFHDDEHAGLNSYKTGRSTSNQRIESWWRQFRQRLGQYYMDLFKIMEREGILNLGNPLHIEGLRYCFGHLLKEEIESTIQEWNEHRIRKQSNRNVLSGIPNELYDCPEMVGATDCRKPLDVDQAQILFLEYAQIPRLCCPDFKIAVEAAMPDIQTPTTAEEAYDLFLDILDLIEQD